MFFLDRDKRLREFVRKHGLAVLPGRELDANYLMNEYKSNIYMLGVFFVSIIVLFGVLMYFSVDIERSSDALDGVMSGDATLVSTPPEWCESVRLFESNVFVVPVECVRVWYHGP